MLVDSDQITVCTKDVRSKLGQMYGIDLTSQRKELHKRLKDTMNKFMKAI